jgi:hypothetical protein
MVLELGRVPNPLIDRFYLHDLPRVAPWVWEGVQQVGAERVLSIVRQLGRDPNNPLLMMVWVAAFRTAAGPRSLAC